MRSKEILYDLYVTQRLTTTKIAEMLGVSGSTISNWLRKNDIPIRDFKEAQLAVRLSKDELHDLYTVKDISIDKIARMVGSSEIGITKMLQGYGIPIKDKGRNFSGWNKGKHLSDEQRKRLSEMAKGRTGEKSPRHGAVLKKETREKIANSLKGRFRKHLNPNWQDGGITPYRQIMMGRHEYTDWRNAVYERDNYTCQLCGKASNGDIQAHHIHRVKDCPERIVDVDNGITLCEPCHKSIHFKEKEYAAQFEAIVNSH